MDIVPPRRNTYSTIAMAISLTGEQQKVVQHRGTPLRIVAGPGTGKTSCLVARVISLLTIDHIEPHRILALTFTRAAAKEMRVRLEREGIPPDKLPDVRTLHSKAVAILRRYGHRLGLTESLRPLSETEAQLLVEDLATDLESSGIKLPFRGPTSILSYLKAYRSDQAGRGIPTSIATNPQNLGVYQAFAQAYDQLQKFYRGIDWFRVVKLTLTLFDAHPDVLADVQESIEHLVVDEYQDLNRSEQELLRRLLHYPINLCIVGDEDQSIYETQRFADPAGLISFHTAVPGSTTLPLTICHRCPAMVLEKANALIAHNTQRISGKSPLQVSDPSRKGVVATIRHRSKKAEIEWCVGKIKEFHSKGCKYGEVLLLFGDGSIAEDFISALRKANIPLDVQLRVAGPFDSQCFSGLMAILRLLTDKTDNLALRQSLGNWPNIGAKTIQALRQISTERTISLWDAVSAVAGGPTAYPSIARRRSVINFHEAMTKLMTITELDRFIPTILDGMPGCTEDAGIKILKDYFAMYREREAAVGISEVLSNFEQEREAGSFEKLQEDLPDKVRVMTMHSAKGLEAGVVFAPALEDDLMPGLVSNLEERRRLFYVSVTRAKQMLLLSWASQRTGKEIHRAGGRMLGKEPSRFLKEMGA